MKTSIIGMGNPIITDDAVGVRLARDLHARFAERADVTWIDECSIGGLNLLDVVAGCDRLIVLDSLKTRDARPGDWHHFTAVALRPTMNLSNVHDANFATSLALGRRLGLPLPADEDVHIFGVEIVDNLTFGDRMTSDLEARYPALLEEIADAVGALLR